MGLSIVFGSNGYIGNALTKYLLSLDERVIGIGRKAGSSSLRQLKKNRAKFQYIQFKNFDSLEIDIRNLNLDLNNAIFYNTAWSGLSNLTNGDLNDQLSNVSLSANSIIFASKLKIWRYVNIGSLQETFLEKFLDEDNFEGEKKELSRLNYSLSKLAAREYNKLIAYFNKIEYIHIRFSALISKDLRGRGYINSTLLNIYNKLNYVPPNNQEYFDLCLLDEAIISLRKIAIQGKPSFDYYLGTGKPSKLSTYFDIFSGYINNGDIKPIPEAPPEVMKIFNPKDFLQDTLNEPLKNFSVFCKDLKAK